MAETGLAAPTIAPERFAGLPVLVAGLGRTGTSVARHLAAFHPPLVDVQDRCWIARGRHQQRRRLRRLVGATQILDAAEDHQRVVFHAVRQVAQSFVWHISFLKAGALNKSVEPLQDGFFCLGSDETVNFAALSKDQH